MTIMRTVPSRHVHGNCLSILLHHDVLYANGWTIFLEAEALATAEETKEEDDSIGR